jgi:hypothetical protein
MWNFDRRLDVAHAVVLQVKFPEGGDPEAGQKMLEEVVVPMAQSQAGFQNGIWMHDGMGNGMGVVVFATAANAEAAKDVLKPPPGGPELVSSAVHEVAAQA